MSEVITGSPYHRIALLDGVTTNTTGASEALPMPVKPDGIRTWTLFVFGTFGGGTCQLQVSADNSNWINVTNGSATSDAVLNVEFRAPFVRLVLSGATSPSITGYLV